MLTSHFNPSDHSKKILAISLDFDGCVFHKEYWESRLPNRLIKYNEKLIQYILNQANKKDYQQITFFVGSNRQSHEIDLLNNTLTKGSCYPALINLVNEISARLNIPCHVDRYLLSDSYGKKNPGENFNHALVNDINYPYDRFVWDPYKTSICYGQTHKIASENKDAEIDYYFFDDKPTIHINFLNVAHSFSDIMPSNVAIKQVQYALGEISEKIDGIKQTALPVTTHGTGIIDDNYQHNVTALAKCSGYDFERGNYGNGDPFSMNGIYLCDVNVIDFKNCRKLSLDCMKTEINHEINQVSLHQQPYYNEITFNHFKSQLSILSNLLFMKLNDSLQSGHTIEKLMLSYNFTLLHNMTNMLRSFNLESMNTSMGTNTRFGDFNFKRHTALITFINQYRYYLPHVKATNQMLSFFKAHNTISDVACDLANMVNKFIEADFKEFKRLHAGNEYATEGFTYLYQRQH